VDTGMKRLLRRPNSQKRVLTSTSSKPLEEKFYTKNDGYASDGSVHDSNSEAEEVSIPKKSSKKVVKRRVKKVVRKAANSE